MNFIKFMKLLDSEQNRFFNKIFSIKDFQETIKRERFLSDRNNHGFSLIIFNAIMLKEDNNMAKKLMDILKNRLRKTDILGWYDPNRISVLLPDTDYNGAQNIADKISKRIDISERNQLLNIYTYPTEKWESGNGEKLSSRFIDVSEDAYTKLTVVHKIPFWKRVIDVLVSSAGIILLSPLLFIVALIIKLVSPGQIFFRQERVGLEGKTFNFLKFRTMEENNDSTIHREYLKDLINDDKDSDKPMEKLTSDSRIITFGAFLRKSCIDELPQLINVFRGDMSLVGPRPCIPYEAEEYLRWHARRFDITPGMTGLWQVNGKNKTSFKEMIRFDIEYASQQSLWFDVMILLKTPMVVFSQIFEGNGALNKKVVAKQKDVKVRPMEVVLYK